MKDGTLSKKDLFASLSELKRERSPRRSGEDANSESRVVADLVGAMRAGKLSKGELLESLSSMRQEPRDEVTQEVSEAAMWAELRPADSREAPDSRPATPPPPPPKRSSTPRSMTRSSSDRLRRLSEPRSHRDDGPDDRFTFRPNIKELPAEYAKKRRSTDFLERVERWRLERERALEKRVAEDVDDAMGECTFQPRISQNSRKAAALRSDGRKPEDRLYEEDGRRRLARETRASLDSSQRESQFEKDHPFRPTRFADDLPVKPRYARRKSEPPKKQPDECTFNPRVNGVRDDMDLAKRYVASAVFDRLTARRPASARAYDDDEEIETPRRRRRSTASDWQTFLARQKAFDAKKSKRVEGLRQTSTPKFRPRLTTSRSDAEPDFMARLAVAARRRDRRDHEAKAAESDGECTFAPTISDLGSRRERRSVDELSAGDALRRETSRRLLKLKDDHDHKYSFKPTLLADQKPQAESRLQLHAAPDTYLDRLKLEHQRRQDHRRRLQEDHDSRLLSEATFAPTTTKCPTYIKRIARGMALAKKADMSRSLDEPAARPTWR